MTEKEIFQHLQTLANAASDPRGVGAAALVENGEILASATSSETGDDHAEARLFAALADGDIAMSKDSILYTTIEPCSQRTSDDMPPDDVSLIIENGVTQVVFAVASPNYAGDIARKRLSEAGITLQQLSDADLVATIANTFNDSIDPDNPVAETKPTTILGLFITSVTALLSV